MFSRRIVAALAVAPLLALGFPTISATASTAPETAETVESAPRAVAGLKVGKRVSANVLLNKLPVRPEQSSSRYDRDRFEHWTELPGRCDTRTRVLRAETVKKMPQGCSKRGGRWLNEYTGRYLNSATRVEIDHRVALAEAWRSGASEWSEDRRRGFANDLGYAHTLVAVGSKSNTAKSDHDPSRWQPKVGKCKYVTRWVAVKYRWRLAVDAVEKRAINKRLATCTRAQKRIKVPPAGKKQTSGRTESPDTSTNGEGDGPSDPMGMDCPSAYPIKGNANSMIYHLPGGTHYDITRPEECFATESAAQAAGYRAARG